jgi:muramoyltetrapeptide carboxypeptidase
MPSSHLQLVKPRALRPGDTVGIIAPASNIKRTDLEAGCAALRRAGYNPFYLDSILEQDLYFAGSVARRASEMQEMFSNDEVRAIVCARGGYGTNYLLRALDMKTIEAHPKIFLGYSDITSLLTYFTSRGLVTFHGPMAAKDWAHGDGVDLSSWHAALSGGIPWEVPINAETEGLVDGDADGVLNGGCLSILVAALGTPYEIQTEGAILFLEDIAAKPYQIDRMLMQLKLAGKLDTVRGIIFGEMLNCVQTAQDYTLQGYTLREVVTRIVGDLGVPVAFGLRSGHVTSGNITLPIGVQARLSVSAGRVSLRILESAVQP